MMENIGAQKEISLKEIVQVIWDGKILIAIITVVALILSALYTFVIASPRYESSAMFTVRLKESVITPYGEYQIPFKTMVEYTSLVTSPETLQRTCSQLGSDITHNQLKNSIGVRSLPDTNMFLLTATAASPEKAYEMAYTHAQSYLYQMNYTLGGMAINEFHNSLSTQIKKGTKELEGLDKDISNTMQLLENTEKAIYLENALISQEQYALISAAEGRFDWDKIRGQKILTQELNPSYLNLLERATEMEIERSSLLSTIDQATKYVEELEIAKQSLAQAAGSCTDDESFASISDLVVIISNPETGQIVGPRNSFNLAIGLVLGMMLGVFVIFIKAYWGEVI